jgi:recombination protein RecR
MSAIDDLTGELARLPGIGRKTALRLTYHLLKQPAEQTRRLADALVTLSDRVRPRAMLQPHRRGTVRHLP